MKAHVNLSLDAKIYTKFKKKYSGKVSSMIQAYMEGCLKNV